MRRHRILRQLGGTWFYMTGRRKHEVPNMWCSGMLEVSPKREVAVTPDLIC